MSNSLFCCPPKSTAAAARREAMYRLHRPILRTLFDAEGRAKGDERTNGGLGNSRVRFWHSYAALSSDDPQDVRLGNAILRHTLYLPGYDFGMTGLLHAFVRWRDRFEPDVLNLTEDCIARSGTPQMTECPGFVGMNDNFPAMATMVAALCGEHNANPAPVAWAAGALRGFAAQLDACDTNAEFNSPTYSSITLACMAELVNFVAHEEIRELALRIEQQLWLDLCSRFHMPTGIQGGPSSRSYMTDSCGHLTSMCAAYAVAFPDVQFSISPENHAYGKEPRWVRHHGSAAYVAAAMAWRAVIDYHPPSACREILTRRTLPATVAGKAFCAFRWIPDDWRFGPGGQEPHRFRKFLPVAFAPTWLTTYLAEDFTLSSASGALACGTGSQQDSFLLAYRRRRPTEGEHVQPEDTRTAFARYAYNDRLPPSDEDGDLFADEGLKSGIQDGGSAVVLYRPGDFEIKDITSMRLSIVLPMPCSRPEAVWLGDTRLERWEAESETAVPVWIEDGRMRIVFRPLALTRYHSAGASVRVREHGPLLLVDFLNYEGPPRSLNFHRQAVHFVQNGFICEAASIDEDTDFDAFRKRMNAHELSDAIDDHGVRHVHYRRGDIDLAIAYDPSRSDAIPPAWIGGRRRIT